MHKVTRNSYSLFQRKTGSQTIWYARFWDDELQVYSGKRSTGQTTKAAANRQIQQWLIDGLPKQERKVPKVSQQRILTAIRKSLIEAGTIAKEEVHEDSELIKGIIPQGKPCTHRLRRFSAASAYLRYGGVLYLFCPHSFGHVRASTDATSLRS
jgi:hypothetical protein